MTDPNIMPDFDLFPRITRVAKAVGNLFVMHQLASHGNHFNHDPLASPVEPVTSWPLESDGIVGINQVVDAQALQDYERVFDGTQQEH